MTELLDAELQVWLPSADDEERSTRAAALASGAEIYISVPAGNAFPQLQVEEDGARVSITVHGGAKARVALRVQARDAVTLWQPGSQKTHSRIPASWEDPQTISALDGFAVGALLAPGDRTIAAWAAEAGDERLLMRAGLIEETAELLVTFDAARQMQQPIRIELDLTGATFPDAVGGVVERIYGTWNTVDDRDERPVYCTWYFLHLAVDGTRLQQLAAPAAALGFGTLIIDDGWQTAETERGYGSAGDWIVDPAKIPDPRALLRTWADHDIRVLWWVGTPFTGYRTQAYQDSDPLFHEPALDAAILDPRDDTNRARLIGRLRRLLNETGAHGLKLDFLERLTSPRADLDVDQAAMTLLRELVTELRADDPHLSIEFREPYYGPAATRSATMMRVGDCPMSPTRNRVGIVDLRLATRGTAVHADPVMWGNHDSPARVAQHLQNALFGVLQVSMDLDTLSADHTDVLRFWLDFATQNKDTILRSHFRPERPDLEYPVITAADHDTVITGRYQPTLLRLPAGNWRTWHILNADDPDVILHNLDRDTFITTVRDAAGRIVAKARGPLQPALHIPTGGLATIERPQTTPDLERTVTVHP